MDIDASMATLRPKSVLMSCSFNLSVSLYFWVDDIKGFLITEMAFGACSEMRAVRPLIPMTGCCGMCMRTKGYAPAHYKTVNNA